MKTVKRFAALLTVMLLIIALAGCGDKDVSPQQKAMPAQTSAQNEAEKETIKPAEPDYSEDYIGTWKVTGATFDGEYITVKELESYGITDISDIYLVVYPDGTSEYYYKNGTDTDTWMAKEDRITMRGTDFIRDEDHLYRVIDGDKLYFYRISKTAGTPDIQTGPDNTEKAAGPVQKNNEQVNNTEPEPEKKSDQISPELKAFLDSYEAFVDEYVEFMEHYNASDFSQLAKYAQLLQKYTDFAAKADDWESKDLNDAETVYYMEVMNRVSVKLLKAAQQ